MAKALIKPDTFNPNYEERRKEFVPIKAAPEEPATQSQRAAPHETSIEEGSQQHPAEGAGEEQHL